MSNGNLAIAKAFFLATSLVASGGCDIGAATAGKTNVESVAPDDRASDVRYQIDSARNRIWVLTGDGVFLYDVTAPNRIAISLPGWMRVERAFGCLPDLALGPKGEAVVTSNVAPTLWTVHPETLAVTVHPLALDADTDKDVGFSGLTYSVEHGAFFAVSYGHGSLWRIDPPFRSAQKIDLSEPIRTACGLAVRDAQANRVAKQSIRRLGGLRVRTAHEVWDIDFAPSQRSAYVTARERASWGHESCGVC